MILSRKLGFVFIKGRKVGGSSVEIALSRVCGPDDVITPLTEADEAARGNIARNHDGFYNHMPLREVAEKVDISGLRVLCVDRSPYAKVISMGNWRSGAKAYEGSAITSTPAQVQAEVDKRRIDKVRNIDLYRLDGVAKPWRYQDLEAEIAALAGELREPIELPHVKRGMMSDTLNPEEWLTRKQIEKINVAFSEEFEVFGYSRIEL